jgi:hypothetical protein
MAALPQQRLLASYWIPAVGISDPPVWVTVPLTEIAKYRLPNGAPQTNVVFLMNATFTGTPGNFKPPYISIPDGILQQMTLQPGQRQTNVQYLQSLGIKVLLSVLGYNTHGQPGMGWDGVPAGENANFAKWMKQEVIDKYGLDGIDIDNEFSKLPENKPAFMSTVGYLRESLSGSLLSKALWQDEDYFLMPVLPGVPNAGKYLARLLDFGCTMAYGVETEGQKQMVQNYHDLTVNETWVGMNWQQLCIGVQAGPPELDWMTNIQEVYELAKWVVQPQSPSKPTPPILGMMLFTFPQDIQQWTHWPQNSPGFMYPNPKDHQWQLAIIRGMYGLAEDALTSAANPAT